MQKSVSLEKLISTEIVDNTRNSDNLIEVPSSNSINLPRRKKQSSIGSIQDSCYSISIKPRTQRSRSLSDLDITNSEFPSDLYKHATQIITELKSAYGSGDAGRRHCEHCCTHDNETLYMSWSVKGKQQKIKVKSQQRQKQMTSNSYGAELASEFIQHKIIMEPASSVADNSSVCSLEHMMVQKTTFPFESTPSGNLKIQSNQVVFQSSTVGVLLADPTQAKVQVKFEGNDTGEGEDEEETNSNVTDTEPPLQYGNREHAVLNTQAKAYMSSKSKTPCREDKGKDLGSLGYALAEPVDWTRVQVPKKQDLFQEFYRRIHNYINTDTLVHIGDEQFHCHSIVLQIYSSFFDLNRVQEIELPITNVTPDSFHTLYEWMIFSGPDSNKVIKRDNVLDLFCAAQFLAIKELEDQCWSFIVNENLFTEDTAFALFREARSKGMTPVMEIMVPRVMRFFLPLVASTDFLELDPEELITFLSSNHICVTSEIEVLMAGIRWLYGDWSNRRQYAIEVMQCVRFGLISPWQLVDIKRNPDNGEILEIVNMPEVQQMVDDGLAYVIIKYWYGNNSQNYYHWIDVLGLTEPAERSWIGEEQNHVTYKDFLKYLEQYMVPKEQMYQQMSVMQPPRRSEEGPAGSTRGLDDKRTKLDFPLPSALTRFTGDKEKSSFPTMSEFFDNRRRTQERSQSQSSSPTRSPPIMAAAAMTSTTRGRDDDTKKQEDGPSDPQATMYEPPERDSAEEMSTMSDMTITSDSSSFTAGRKERRHSIAANFLATATAALARSVPGTSRVPAGGGGTVPRAAEGKSPPGPSRDVPPAPNIQFQSPNISLFHHSKESMARINMNKLSTSILGPSNKNYITEGSLFNWERETVLVFGGIDPHTAYGVGRNTGKDIYRYDPVTNVWDYVGDLPEPRHHHSVAFLRGRVYLVGGADPRDDDVRGRSVVVSTVWSYEPVSRSWYSESGLATPRKNFGLVVHRMALYAIGGQDKKGRVLRSVEKFDPKSGNWTEVQSMNVARMAVATTKYREYIWAAGGMTGEKRKPVCKVVECYNSKTNEWTEIHNLRFPRCFASLFTMNDKLHLIGGAGKVCEKEKSANSVSSIDVWDWEQREWKQVTEMSIPRHGHALAYLGTQLIIIGGVTTIYMRALNNVESYCCERGAWIRGVAALPSPLSGHGAVTLPPASLM